MDSRLRTDNSDPGGNPLASAQSLLCFSGRSEQLLLSALVNTVESGGRDRLARLGSAWPSAGRAGAASAFVTRYRTILVFP